jgi:hypothetical protein
MKNFELEDGKNDFFIAATCRRSINLRSSGRADLAKKVHKNGVDRSRPVPVSCHCDGEAESRPV